MWYSIYLKLLNIIVWISLYEIKCSFRYNKKNFFLDGVSQNVQHLKTKNQAH